MNRLPWAPLNAGVFIIILGGVFLLAFFNIGATLWTAFPLIFLFFGIWMIVEAFVVPPANAYAPPRSMILLWGSVIGALGILWYVGATNLALLPIAFVVLLIMAGISAVGYSFLRAKPNTPRTPTS
jgi:uncharacterized membrane protein HdeD (DUF308 family)